MVMCNLFVFWIRNYSIVYQRRMARASRANRGVLLASQKITIAGREPAPHSRMADHVR